MSTADKFADLDALAATPGSDGQVLEAMDAMALSQHENVGPLVERYAPSTTPTLVRPLVGLLARHAGSRKLGAIGPHILRAVELLQIDDDSARANLLTAIQRASMYRDLVEPGAIPPTSLMVFLISCTRRSELVQSTLARCILNLDARRMLAGAPVAQLEDLRAGLRTITAEPGSLLEDELQDLAGFLAEQ